MIEYTERLRKLREFEKINQTELAKELGISQNTYSQYETGARQPSLEMLIKLAEFYFVSTDYILGLTDNPEPYPKRK
ncbi:MAG: helix-turn-helix transcriptional regulator [Clostridia bacterium]|nr:helix-turn-helix transcriptional regulator [Clostridia bacterium]